MKKLIVILLAGCTFIVSQSVRNVAADDEGSHGTPLRKLAGTYSVTFQESLAVCLANTPSHPPAPCGSPGSIVARFQFLGIGGAAFDAAGNFCIPFTATRVDLPVDASPTEIIEFNNVGRITSYDPTTGTGDKSFTAYAGGQCIGASFDSTGATVQDHGTERVAVSNGGKRIETVVTSDIDPVGAIGGFSLSVILLRQ